MPLLEVDKVSKSFGGVRANREVSLTVDEGDIVGLIGPNGSGKSTLFNLIAGAYPADGGRICFGGREIGMLRAAQIARLGLIRTYQQTRIYREMDCMDNMRVSAPAFARGESDPPGFAARLQAALARPPQWADDEALELLDFVGLSEKRGLRAGELSFGQQKLLELAMALMRRPRLLLLDEPTAGINPTLINSIIARLREVNQSFGVTLLVIEHNMRVMMDLARRVFCLAHGEVLAAGAADDIRRDQSVIDAYLGAR